jgi:FMN-dependent oxidoreductase (nitrilotriacetate monooxygenase family)
MYHLAWFMAYGYGLQPWNATMAGPWTGRATTEWMKPDIYIDLCSSLERAGFDYLLIEDTSQVDDIFGGTTEAALRFGHGVPKNDPMPLVPLITSRTKHISVVPTITSTFYPPYLAARMLVTLDHLTEGRVGFNLVTSLSDNASQNYGMDVLPPKEIRYEQAGEWVDIVKGLMGSWEPDAIVADVENQIYADYSKVHRLDYLGKYFKCRGPLNTAPGPQGVLPMVQAGNSPHGRDITARHANSILAVAKSPAEMRAFREDMHARLRSYGRDPSQCKILFLISPILAATDEEARDRAAAQTAMRSTPEDLERHIYWMAKMTGFDFSRFDLSITGGEILSELERSGRLAQSISAIGPLFKTNSEKSLREICTIGEDLRSYNFGLIGSPETVASMMDEMMQEVGGDGFLMNLPTTRLKVAEVCDGLAPVLQRRGSIRTHYEGKTLKENLLAF